ncbi:hypothetical protein ACTXKH_14265 [Brachybacterium tyrofermentans]|uniref:hypothetical protein n=1 Tax=Brachybacterium tyrofermentans TaxID=47848 RepID=UPI003FB941E9
MTTTPNPRPRPTTPRSRPGITTGPRLHDTAGPRLHDAAGQHPHDAAGRRPLDTAGLRADGTAGTRPDDAERAAPRSLRILLLLGTLTSLISAALGIRWLMAPDAALFTASATPPPLLELIGAGPLYTLQIVVALLGAVVGVVGLSRRPGPALAVVGGLQVALFGLGFASFMTLAQTGYLIALSMPILLSAVGVLLVLHGGRARWVVGVPLLALLILGAVAGAGTIAHLVSMILPSLLATGPLIVATAHFVVAGALWAAISLLALRDTGTLRALGAWTVRRRRILTLIAACGPLPYALLRLTWLTPWPLLGGEMAAGDPSVRVWGLALSTGAWLGVLLTIGLIRPWGEVFPRWFPAVGGRPVPVAFAAIPGFTVAALLCFAAVPVMLSASALGLATALEFALVFPCWLWGPALALAVWGYVGHRRSTIDPRAGGPASARMGA